MCQKHQWRARGGTGQLATRLKWTGVNFNQCINCELPPSSGDIYIFVGLMLMLWFRETLITHKGTKKLLRPMRRSISRGSDWGNIASCQLSNTFFPRHMGSAKNAYPCLNPKWFLSVNDGPARLNNTLKSLMPDRQPGHWNYVALSAMLFALGIHQP